MTQILVCIKCFLSSSAGFRALSNIFQILQGWISGIMTPAYTTIRQWILKIGLYRLTCLKKLSSGGWFFIIDTSIQMGNQKCVVVLGVKKLDISQNFCPTLEEVEPLIVRPLYASSGEVINEILEEATRITEGEPIAVISDEGSEMKKGIRLFSQNHPQTIHLFDISHKINISLKKELENDPIWLTFRMAAASLIQHLKLSSIAYLIPPRQRSKERMHSAFPLIEWGLNVLQFLDSKAASKLSQEERSKIEWIENYRFSLPHYLHLEELCKQALDLVHQKGYYIGLGNDFLKKTEHLCLTDKKLSQFQDKIKISLQQEEMKLPQGAHYLGSSEVIESLFGKFKAIEGHHASSGLTSLVLAIPAIVGKLDENITAEGLRTISIQDIEKWNEENIGQTFLSQRRTALATRCQMGFDLDLEFCD